MDFTFLFEVFFLIVFGFVVGFVLLFLLFWGGWVFVFCFLLVRNFEMDERMESCGE